MTAMEILIKASQLILSLSILVVLHELGHFAPAKWFGMRVEKFYLFFDPWFSLFKYKKGETEYGIGWIPLGGYVKISGMIDESMDKEQMKKPAEDWEFRSKPAWQRLIVMMGGVTVNLVLAMVIYAMILFVYGEKYITNENVKHGIWCVDSVAINIGLQNGDKIISVDGKKIERFSEITLEMLYAKTIEVERSGEPLQLKIAEGLTGKLVDSKTRMLVAPRIPFYVADFTKASNAEKAGIKLKDKIIGVNSQTIQFFDEFKPIVTAQKGKEISVQILREGKELSIPVKVSSEGMIGVGHAGLIEMGRLGEITLNTQEFGFFESFPAGINLAIEQLSKYVRQFKLILNPDTGAYKGVGSFLSIGNLFSGDWHWESFWNMTAMLSVVLAFMNILPIPALDGGHVMFLLYEVISGKKPSDKFMEYAQYVGMALLLTLMVYAIGNDIFRLF